MGVMYASTYLQGGQGHLRRLGPKTKAAGIEEPLMCEDLPGSVSFESTVSVAP